MTTKDEMAVAFKDQLAESRENSQLFYVEQIIRPRKGIKNEIKMINVNELSDMHNDWEIVNCYTALPCLRKRIN